jgi:ATP phosphoribosyltransferase
MSRQQEKLIVAMPKGRIFEEAVDLLRRAGVNLPPEFEDSRKLIIPVPEAGMDFILAKPTDVPTYVEYGVADIGVVGKDVLVEEDRDVYELLDLNISKCKMAVAGLPDWKDNGNQPRVATKFPRIASTYFREKGQQVEVIKLNGSIELAPIIGLADRIVDIVSTGQTLKENGLVVHEEIMPISTRLIANRVSYRMKSEAIDYVYQKFASVVEKKED